MAIVEIKIDTMERFADRQAFGEAGSYLRIRGIAKGEIDPAAPGNSSSPISTRHRETPTGWWSTEPTSSSCAQ
jgi:hypothetical protein